MNRNDVDIGVSPRRAAKPRKPISDYQLTPSTAVAPDDEKSRTCSPPNSSYKESTRMETSLGSSPPSASLVKGPQSVQNLNPRNTSHGASPNLVRGEDVMGKGRRTNTSLTRLKSKKKNKRSEDELSEDDQPSGSCQFVGSHVSNLSSSTLNDKTVNYSFSSNTSRTRQRKREPSPVPPVCPPCPCVPEDPGPKSFLLTLCKWLSVVCILSMLMLLFALSSQPQGRHMLFAQPESFQLSAEHWDQTKKQVMMGIKNLRSKFPNQTKSTWVLISSTIKSPMQPSPEYPGVLLLLSSPSTRLTSHCLAKYLLLTTSQALSRPGLTPPSTSELAILPSSLSPSPHTAKTQLTDRLQAALSDGAATVIFDLHRLHPVPALTLHAFADNSNAPHKRAVLLATLTEVISKDEEGLSSEAGGDNSPENRAEKVLKEKWAEELGYDKYYALVSRLVINVVDVKEESVGTLAELCPEY
jgi:hypothetical protein